MSQLIGLFGGTFDPVHLGHLNSVALLHEQLNFEKIHWILSARPPHKDQVSVNVEHRFAMLQLALAGHDNFVPDDTEIARETASYTFDTVQQFKEKYPQASLCLIIGGDSLEKLHTWYRYQELIDQIHLIVLHRPGYAFDVPDYLHDRLISSSSQLSEYHVGKLVLFAQPEFDISSTQLRQALRQDSTAKSSNALIRQFMAPSVIDYIHQHRLYKTV